MCFRKGAYSYAGITGLASLYLGFQTSDQALKAVQLGKDSVLPWTVTSLNDSSEDVKNGYKRLKEGYQKLNLPSTPASKQACREGPEPTAEPKPVPHSPPATECSSALSSPVVSLKRKASQDLTASCPRRSIVRAQSDTSEPSLHLQLPNSQQATLAEKDAIIEELKGQLEKKSKELEVIKETLPNLVKAFYLIDNFATEEAKRQRQSQTALNSE